MTAPRPRTVAVGAPLPLAPRAPTFRVAGLRGQLGAHLDPWLGVDHFVMSAPFFAPHLHAGFSAVTYVFTASPGGFVNRDSLGDHTMIAPGGLHWTQAGAGLVHHEVPERTGVAAHGLQLFVNLAAADELAPPEVFRLRPDEVPEVEADGARVRVLAGAALGARSPLRALRTPVTLLDAHLAPGAALTHPVPPHHHAWLLVVGGAGEAGAPARATPLAADHAAALAPDGDALALRAGPGGLHVVIGHGAPLREPVCWDGPVAMSTAARAAETLARHARGELGHL